MASAHFLHNANAEKEKMDILETAPNKALGDIKELHGGNLVHGGSAGLHRRLGNRHVQLIAIGGSIGTGLFVAIGGALHKGGPASLLLAVIIESMMLSMVNNCIAEMATYMPVSGGFISHAGKWVDDAWGFLAGWNLFIFMALSIPFEISAVNLFLEFWRDDIPAWAVCVACLGIYITINLFTVHAYGETEFWLSGGKVLLMSIVFGFTFITMVGGNPNHDAYGFRHWRTPGAFAAYAVSGDLGRFEGFLECLWTAIFIVTGPEYVSSLAAEARHPRIYIKQAFKVVYWRSIIFFVGGAVCVGIILAYNDTTLSDAVESGKSSASASPYIIAMENLGVTGLPHLACALMLTTVFSAGNTYWYATTRGLYSLAAGGRAPRIFTKTNHRGIPIYCNVVALAFGCLSFLQLSGGAMTVLNWLISLTTANILINYIIIAVTYICFYRACQAQGFDRSKLPYYAYFQPYCGYISLAWMALMLFCFGYRSFTPWSVQGFFLSYTMLLLTPILFVSWKLFHGTRWLRPREVDLHWQADVVALYEANEVEQPVNVWREMTQMVRLRNPSH
ncbi:hypothetical protein N7492_003905 [Penicillium capsulatum]|uniref:Amino acid permease/ SLC12A domain-containing protein n=1 Tax=Penicillium capsulatum TaxID=69766 RepID=A0A9W9ILE8_9EURO|nr:hypothetical protein N7492_003905 [Penicillium capsulatum]KAJ6121515.1 hypothetical protein N7512_003980 [Penicillium capsulatum]